MTAPIRVLVADDSAFARKVVREVLSADARFRVVDIARDGLDALEKIVQLTPDVVTLDLVMPNLDGHGVLHALAGLDMANKPRVVVVTTAEDDSDAVVSALQAGAVDVVRKPTALANDELFGLGDDLRTKVAEAAAAKTARRPVPAEPAPDSVSAGAHGKRIVAIGASTGGPQALTALLGALPREFPVPVVVALHMPVGYTSSLAHRLNDSCEIEVVEAHDGLALVPGRAVIARAGMHLKVKGPRPLVSHLDFMPLGEPHRPSVDVLLESAAEVLGAGAVGVILTGMGEDGLKGARALRAAGGLVFSESESTCIVYGMPRAVEAEGLSTAVVDLDKMAAALVRLV